MPCVALPVPPLPTLPGGITAGTPLPPQIEALETELQQIIPCCKLPPAPIPPVPQYALSVTLDPAVATTIATAKGYIMQVVTWANSLPLKCPKE